MAQEALVVCEIADNGGCIKSLPKLKTVVGVPMPLADESRHLLAGTGSSQHPAARCLAEVICSCVSSMYLHNAVQADYPPGCQRAHCRRGS